ncbi:MAG: hypothetical protein AB1898_31235 [Acidobacteriota bacterium]
MGHLREQSVVRIDKEEGPAPICFESRKWDLTTWQALIYASPDRNQFEPFFEKHDAFKVFVKEGSAPIKACVGRYRGQTEKFDPLNYLHQRHALLGGFGHLPEDSLKAGVKGHRVYWGNVVNKGIEIGNWISNPVNTFAEKVITGRPKFFVAFADSEHSRVVHMQEAIHYLMLGSHQVLTLGDFWASCGDQVEGFLEKLG